MPIHKTLPFCFVLRLLLRCSIYSKNWGVFHGRAWDVVRIVPMFLFLFLLYNLEITPIFDCLKDKTSIIQPSRPSETSPILRVSFIYQGPKPTRLINRALEFQAILDKKHGEFYIPQPTRFPACLFLSIETLYCPYS